MTAPTAHADAFDAPSSGSCSFVTAAAVAQTGREAKKKKEAADEKHHLRADIYLRRRTWIMMLIGHGQPWRGGSTVIILSDLPR
ncbi:uncharacterized protein TrAtP1_000552 [Trichoderma atroviride]|uniref:Uncharacterized protein n=1 Tax=Hypocrea atroviridis (strain ATCC 20476 / IMI 206040) TaxID=452589 RepID=G9NJ15_HYPAI|nr:uncharacterized protein TRIATDRAFT_304768 [Trichoderma atroviride IMI 206040]EHK48892.1 hypothetical protein TRIATDRAFT_304768 [Trichoderma atroviride IMI 206040]UKZ59235.1 hypothetical protein TrAtP1_000552 [Trichoderma atroviride]